MRTPGSFRSLGVFSHTSPAPSLTTMISEGQDLLLNRAMLSVDKTPYVDRFARDWHRLSTTDHSQPLEPVYARAALDLRARHENEGQTHAEHHACERNQKSAPAPGGLNLKAHGALVVGDHHLARYSGA